MNCCVLRFKGYDYIDWARAQDAQAGNIENAGFAVTVVHQ